MSEKRTNKQYPLPGFPQFGLASMQDWVPIDERWHCIVYVFHPHGVRPDLYVDGKLVPVSGELPPVNGFRIWDSPLSRAQVKRVYAETQT